MSGVQDGDDLRYADCMHCGKPVDTLEPDHFKTVSDSFGHNECVAEHCFHDREKVATTEGVFSIEPARETKIVGGEEEITARYWQADCPVCWQTHTTETQDEDVRNDFVDTVLDCCGAEWLPPEDYIEDCDVCGESHREKTGCRPPARRHPFPGVDEDYNCTDCEWDGHGEELQGPFGECPECDSPAVEVLD